MLRIGRGFGYTNQVGKTPSRVDGFIQFCTYGDSDVGIIYGRLRMFDNVNQVDIGGVLEPRLVWDSGLFDLQEDKPIEYSDNK